MRATIEIIEGKWEEARQYSTDTFLVDELSLTEASKKLGITSEALYNRINRLREIGHKIPVNVGKDRRSKTISGLTIVQIATVYSTSDGPHPLVEKYGEKPFPPRPGK